MRFSRRGLKLDLVDSTGRNLSCLAEMPIVHKRLYPVPPGSELSKVGQVWIIESLHDDDITLESPSGTTFSTCSLHTI